MAIQLLAAPNVGHLSLAVAPRRGPVHHWDVNIHIGRKSVIHTSKALVTSFLTMSFYVILLSSLKRRNEKISFFQCQENSTLFIHVKNESIRRTGSNEKSSSKILLVPTVAL